MYENRMGYTHHRIVSTCALGGFMQCEKCRHLVENHGLSCLLCGCNMAQWHNNTVEWKTKRYHEITVQENKNSKSDSKGEPCPQTVSQSTPETVNIV